MPDHRFFLFRSFPNNLFQKRLASIRGTRSSSPVHLFCTCNDTLAPLPLRKWRTILSACFLKKLSLVYFSSPFSCRYPNMSSPQPNSAATSAATETQCYKSRKSSFRRRAPQVPRPQTSCEGKTTVGGGVEKKCLDVQPLEKAQKHSRPAAKTLCSKKVYLLRPSNSLRVNNMEPSHRTRL